MTHQSLRGFSTGARQYAMIQGVLPDPLVERALKEILENPDLKPIERESRRISLRRMSDGCDEWGHRLIFEHVDPGKTAFIRSVGGNGQDDHGQGDDIQVEVDRGWSMR